MADKTLREILQDTRNLIAVKTAEYQTTVKEAKGLEGKGKEVRLSAALDSTNKTLDAGEAALEPTKKPLLSSDAKANPPSDGSGTKADLRGKNESNETDRSGTLEAGDAAPVSKTEKDLISGDANAKTAAAQLCNEILQDIRNAQVSSKKAEAKAEVAKPAPVKAAAAKVDVKPTVAPIAPVADKKASEGPMLELTTEVLAKIASMVLSTDEGAEFVEGFMAKQAGAEAATETLNFLAKQAELAEKQAAYEQGQADAEALINQAIYQAGMNATKSAAVQTPFAKLGQAVADSSMSDLMGQMGGAGAGAGAPGAEGAGAPPMDPAAMGGAPEAGGAEGEISPEELQSALEQLAQEGTITPEEAQQVMQYISQGGDAGGAEAGAEGAGAPPMAGGAPEVPAAPAAQEPGEKTEAGEGAGEEKGEKAEGESKSEESKEGSVKAATAGLLAAIRAERARK